MNRNALSNYLLCCEGREELFYDIVLVQFGPDVLERNITKSGQSELRKMDIGASIAQKG